MRNPSAQSAAQIIDIKQRKIVLFVVLATYLMILLDTSIVITGLPDIRTGLGFSPTGLAWVQNAYMLSFGGLLMLGARAGDLMGRKRVFLFGLLVFTVSSLAIGLAQSPAQLLIARSIQGIGAATLAPSTLALLSTYYPEGPERHRALAYYAATAGIGASLGLVVGGIFADWISWRVGFFINVPLGFVLFVLGRRFLAESQTHDGAFDLIGAISSTLGMTALVYGIVRSASAGWGDDLTIGSMLVAFFLLMGFVIVERRAAQPILPLRLVASRERSGAYIARMAFVGAMFSFFFFTTQFMQGVLDFTPFEAGVGFLPMTIPTFVASLFLPRLTALIGNGRVLSLALLTCAIGMFWLAQADVGSHYLRDLAIPMLLIGFGNGLALGPLTIAGVSGVAKTDSGAASGLVNVAHQLGGALGVSVLVVVFASAAAPGVTGRLGLAHQIEMALGGAALMLLAGFVIAVIFVARPKVMAIPAS